MSSIWLGRWSFAVLAPVLSVASPLLAAEYRVGPGQTYSGIGQVPWYSLRAGDVVYISYQAAPYREKILISSRGTESDWIRVFGIPGPNGELPVISGDGATTGRNMHHRWQDATGSNAVQANGIVQIAPRDNGPKPGYIEVANLQIQDGNSSYRFTAENGVTTNYPDFVACMYSRSADHIVIRDNVLTNCGLGFYNWTGSGTNAWDGLQSDTVIRGNYFYNNGVPGQYYEHASYTESDRVILEFNRFGPMKSGATGSQIKDRSAGTVIRYNYIEQPQGYMMDLVEPENGDPVLSSRPYFDKTFVYGNTLLHTGEADGFVVHWNADLGQGKGRADTGGTLFFYNNTFLVTRNEPDVWKFSLFTAQDAGGSCPASVRGVIDARNNIWANLPRTANSSRALMFFGGCGSENFTFGRNWVSPGFAMSWNRPYTGKATGSDQLVSPADNNPGFLGVRENDVHLMPVSSAVGMGGPLAPQVTMNELGLDLSPNEQYVYHTTWVPRAAFGPGSDAGAFGRSRRAVIPGRVPSGEVTKPK